ncbi:transposable element Tcb1 transposase [Trichonephila clavipes]|nr:transposable element Tcb1 transposase [Trichonephila clavipes]
MNVRWTLHHPSQCTTSRENRQIVRMAVTDCSVTSRTVAPHIERVCNASFSVSAYHSTPFTAEWSVFKTSIALSTLDAEPQTSPPPMETPWREDAEQLRYAPHTGPAPSIMVWGGIGYHSRTPLVRIASTLNSQRYISEVLEPVVLSYLQGLATSIFQQDNARRHVARIVQRFFVNHQTKLLP